MAKIKRCLDTDCTRYYWLDDDKIINVPKEKCDLPSERRKNPRNIGEFRTMFNQMTQSAKKTIYMTEDPNWKEGDDAVL